MSRAGRAWLGAAVLGGMMVVLVAGVLRAGREEPMNLRGRIAYLHAGLVHVLDLDSGATQVFAVDRAMSRPVWDPTGAYIAYGAGRTRVLSVADSTLAEVGPGAGRAWHPSGMYMTLTRVAQDGQAGGLFNVAVEPVFAAPPPPIVETEMIAEDQARTTVRQGALPPPQSVGEALLIDETVRPYFPAWAPDGALLAFSAYPDPSQNASVLMLLRPDDCATAPGVWDAAACFSAMQPVASGGARNDSAAFSADGTRLAFRRGEGVQNVIVVLDLATGAETVITPEGEVDNFPAWGPGDLLAFARRTPGQGTNTNLFVTDVRTGATQQLTTEGGIEPSWWWRR